MNRDYLSDEGLVALLARGDDEALGALYDRYGRVAWTLARRIVRDPALAEDVVQDAFLTLWRGAKAYRPDLASPKSYLLMLVHRRAVDVVRREERRRAEPLDSSPDTAAEGSTTDEVWSGLEGERVRAALAQLTDEQRELVVLSYYEGFTQSELASRLGLPLGTVKSRMFAGMQRLRSILEQEEQWIGTRA
ncbi:MAG TPA: sigma-70 family RNA polymerase sigma factor [Gaiellaceae bacterium]|jgi:RNA polymerase sigma-70 factor (ECF subfamily)